MLQSFYKLTFWISVFGFIVFIFDYGYNQSLPVQHALNAVYLLVLAMGIMTTVFRYLQSKKKWWTKVFIFDALSVLFTVGIIALHFFSFPDLHDESILYNDAWLKAAIFLTIIREFSEQKINLKRTFLNPAQLFISSFLVVIFLGTFLLMLPNATYTGISFSNALFTSTSAVCVTGLVVVDTGTYFTSFGQFIILILIQLGGLGILTFASYFSYFFKGGTTYETQLSLSEMTSSKKIGEVFGTLKYIILITAIIEFISAVCIFVALDPLLFQSISERVFFSVFHSISAFCNAGFSTLSSSLSDVGFRFNYGLQLIIVLTFILGGLGFPIVANLIAYLKYKLKHLFSPKRTIIEYHPWVLNINSRITLVTTLSLTAFAFVFFYIFEYHHSLEEHKGFGKVITALFGAATPRTAGFNSVDMAAISFPTLMITFLLMWIGASPGSTGGGIKTSTFAIATLNIISLAKGKNRIEIYRREIADISVKRAFATIALSLIVIGLGVIFISVFDPEMGLLKIAFECFSAYSTVGLSLGITGSLSTLSKLVLIVIMFVGRVSMLSILIAVFTKIKHKNYRYPSEEIMIN